MRSLLVLVLFFGVSAWGQVCTHSDLVSTRRTCPCNGTVIFVNVCQGTFGGQGCQDLGSFNFCGSSCAVGSATGCIPGGPKSRVLSGSDLFRSNIEGLSAKEPQIGAVTCNNNSDAFEKWLARTNRARLAQPQRGIGN